MFSQRMRNKLILPNPLYIEFKLAINLEGRVRRGRSLKFEDEV